jgi:hypothetical protein
MFVGSYKRNIAQLILEINSESFNAVAHRVGGSDSWEVLKEVWHHALINRFIEIIILIRAVLLQLLLLLSTMLLRCGAHMLAL